MTTLEEAVDQINLRDFEFNFNGILDGSAIEIFSPISSHKIVFEVGDKIENYRILKPGSPIDIEINDLKIRGKVTRRDYKRGKVHIIGDVVR